MLFNDLSFGFRHAKVDSNSPLGHFFLWATDFLFSSSFSNKKNRKLSMSERSGPGGSENSDCQKSTPVGLRMEGGIASFFFLYPSLSPSGDIMPHVLGRIQIERKIHGTFPFCAGNRSQGLAPTKPVFCF